MQNSKSKIVCLAGPTGVGKTALALALAERLDAEIIGADAFQVYASLPLLTAQPTAVERARVPHHLVGVVPAAKLFDAHRYAEAARSVLADLQARGKIALIVGGAGLYFRALLEGFAPAPPANPALRAALADLPLETLVARLRAADPAAPTQIDVKNPRRVARAIEIVEGSGRPFADFRATPPLLRQAPGLLLVRDRAELHDRIAANVRAMFAAGVTDEVRALGDSVGPTAARAIGLAEIHAHLRGEIPLADCVEKITVATRQYAKRQLTWFRRQTTFCSLDLTASHHPTDAIEAALAALDAA